MSHIRCLFCVVRYFDQAPKNCAYFALANILIIIMDKSSKTVFNSRYRDFVNFEHIPKKALVFSFSEIFNGLDKSSKTGFI